MNLRRQSFKSLGFFFGLFIIVPALVLVLIAVRSAQREEAYIEKRLEGTLLAEVSHVATLVDGELGKIQSELADSSPVPEEANPGLSLAHWKDVVSLVDVPFLLSAQRTLLWPRSEIAQSKAEQDFIAVNEKLFSDELRIPVYQNIAQTLAPPPEVEQESPAQADLRAQKLLTEMEKDPALRQKAYQQAKEKGQQPLRRTVNPSAGLADDKEASDSQESIFIPEPLRFGDIISSGDAGLFPRFTDDRLALYFWKKDGEGRIVGCLLADKPLRDRLAAALPDIYSAVRILTVLDERAEPLVTPGGEPGRDWKRPFVAQEISASLPGWEVAAYLTDPDVIASRANFIKTLMGILVFLLVGTMLTGGLIVLNSIRSEMILARQKTSFVANVSHELKTPLTSIRMFAEMLREGRQPDSAKRKKYLDTMVSESERLTHLINNVLDFSRMEQGKKTYRLQPLDLVRLAYKLAQDFRLRLIPLGFAVRFENKAGEALVRADEESVTQALLNLLSNAEKYSQTVKDVEIEVCRSRDRAWIDIKDRGPGIPAPQAKKIFREFFRADDALTARVRGTGLGLSIARRLAQDQGGDVLYFPREGGGSVFRLQLPLSTEAS